MDLKKNLGYDDSEDVFLYYLDGEERVDVRASYENRAISASFIVGKKYYAVVEYTVNVLPAGEISIGATTVAKKGEYVSVSLSNIPYGAVVDMLYYINSAGEKVEISGDGFYMPSGTVFIGLDYHIPTYVITFVADGKTIFTVTLKYGETVTAPSVPAKAADSKYYYTHGFWSPEIVPATADAVYVARYLSNEISVSDKPQTGTVIYPGLTIGKIEIIPPITVAISQSNVALAAKIALAAFYVLFVFLPIFIIVIVKNARRSRR